MHTLLLNKDGRPLSELPLSGIPWQLAIKLMAMEKITVLETYENWEVHSPSVTLQVPSVAMTTDYVKFSREVKFNRNNIFLRDNFVCQYCNNDFKPLLLSLDHVTPRSKGGKTNWKNIITACKKCNSLRGDNEKIRPLKVPNKPNYYELVAKRKKLPIRIPHESWKTYLDWDDQLIILSTHKHKGDDDG